MAIARLYDFVDGQKAYSQQVDDEFNQLVAAHNANEADLATKVETSDLTNDYYTKTAVQTSGQAAIHWGNITNAPNFADPAWKTAVATPAALPLTGNAIGDMRVVLNDGDGKQAIYECCGITGDLAAQWAKVGDVDWISEEATRVTQEASRVTAESGRVTAETGRVSAETPRVTAENARLASEVTRVANEENRVTAEGNRATAETSRAGAESARVTAESSRGTAETARLSAETTRGNAETARLSAETTRGNNEAARVSAETTRGTSETARVSAETARGSAETTRLSSEDGRATAETTRLSAETGRASAEVLRIAAENARAYMLAYDAAHSYLVGQKATYGGSTYQCTVPCTGVAPTDTGYWILMAAKGADGIGAGDMLVSTYDPTGKATDVFAHAGVALLHKQSTGCTQDGLNSNVVGTNNISTGPNTTVEGYENFGIVNVASDYELSELNTTAQTFSVNSIDGMLVHDDIKIIIWNDDIEKYRVVSATITAIDTETNIVSFTAPEIILAEYETALFFSDLNYDNEDVTCTVQHTEGWANLNLSNGGHVEGIANSGVGNNVHVEGISNKAGGSSCHVEGLSNVVLGSFGHGEGSLNTATGETSHVEGQGSFAASSANWAIITAYDEDAHTVTVYDSDSFTEGDVVWLCSEVSGTRTGFKITDISENIITLSTSTDYFPSSPGLILVPGDNSDCTAHAEGYYTRAFGSNTHAEGKTTYALGSENHAEGLSTQALGLASHSEGHTTIAYGDYTHAEGRGTVATAEATHAEGYETFATVEYSHSEGYQTKAAGHACHAEGDGTRALGQTTHAEGTCTMALALSGHAEGLFTLACSGTLYTITSYNDDTKTITLDQTTGLTVGNTLTIKVTGGTALTDIAIIAINGLDVTLDTTATMDGDWTLAIKQVITFSAAHAEGYDTLAGGKYSHAEGNRTVTEGEAAHAEGDQTYATGNFAHSEGQYTFASGLYSHAEGYNTAASSEGAHAEGYGTVASLYYAHAEGAASVASGNSSHAQNRYTIAQGYAQTAIGMFNVAQGTSMSKENTDNAFIIGNGSDDASRSNAFAVTWAGKATAKAFNNQSLKNNQSVAAQAIAAATRSYIAGTNLQFAAGELQVGSRFRWVFDVTKTAAGTAASTIDICLGTLGTTGDTARVSFAKPAGTAVIDNGRFVIEGTVRAVGASCVIAGHMEMTHNLNATGLATIPAVNVTTISSAFSSATATNIGVCITTGAADAYTIQMVTAESWNL